jgi:hypothetical protein
MKVVTLRKLPAPIARAIQQRARTQKTSFSKAVISLLEDATGENRNRNDTVYTDLDALAGSWSRAESAAFDRELKKQRRIDKEIWE